MNYEDLLSAFYEQLDLAVSGISRDGSTPQIRRPAVDYSGLDVLEFAYLDLTETTVATRSSTSASAGDFTVELHVTPDSGDAYRGAEVAEAIRSHFYDLTVVVSGAASGSPATTRGVVDVTSVRVESLGAVEDRLVFDVSGAWQLRL